MLLDVFEWLFYGVSPGCPLRVEIEGFACPGPWVDLVLLVTLACLWVLSAVKCVWKTNGSG